MTRRRAAPAFAVLFALAVPATAHEVTCHEGDGDLCYNWSRAMGQTIMTDDPQMVGTVTLDLEIDPTGHVSGCTVRQSSGSELVDRSTCSQLQAYAHYRPALDDAGEPAIGADSVTIRWIPRLPPAAPAQEKPAPDSGQPWS